MPEPRFKFDTEFREGPQAFRLFTDEVFGLDTVENTWSGEVGAKARTFNNKFKVGDKMTTSRGNPEMWVVGRRMRSRGPFTDISIIFQGSWDGKERAPIVNRSIQVQSAVLTTDEDERVSVLYRSQVVTARYFKLGAAPVSPQASGFLPSTLQATPFNHDPPKKTLKGRLRYKFVARNVLFEVETIINGKLHRVVEQTVLEIEDQ